MKILVACEESQIVCISFRNRGHEAYSCDIMECSGGHSEWHIKDDVLNHLDDGWDMIIAHPPCTYLTNGGAVRMYPEKGKLNIDRYNKAIESKEFFMKFYNHNCNKICIENPLPMTIIGLPKYDQIVHPYMFGEPYSKKTCLWLKGLPYLNPTNILNNYQPFINGGGGRLNKEIGRASCRERV
jgi:hypothetical protein